MATLTTSGGERVWLVTDWTDLQTLCGVSTPAQVGDRMWYRDGGLWLSRKKSLTRSAVSKDRWIPDDTETFGANDRSTVPFGAIDDDGIWTVTAGNHAFGVANLQDTWDVLGLVLSSGLGAVNIDALSAASGTGPHALQIRCVYLGTSGGAACTISVDGCGFVGSVGGAKGAPASAGTAAENPGASNYHGQFVLAASGGGGGGGGGGSVA